MEKKQISYNLVDDFDHIFDEKGNTFLAFRKVDWSGKGEGKFELRKWYSSASGDETPNKGFSFLTEQGPHNLVKTMLQNDFGYTKEVLESIKDRPDFRTSINQVLGEEDELYDKSYNEDELYIPGNDDIKITYF